MIEIVVTVMIGVVGVVAMIIDTNNDVSLYAIITTINRIAITTTINRIAIITTINRIAIITTISIIAIILEL